MGQSFQRVLRCLALAVATAITLHGPSAQACGGLFCSSTNPVNQAAERIIFAQEGNRTTAVIEIQYQGPSERFAWVLPVPGVPEIGVSSKQALDRLQQATNPVYSFNTTSETCNFRGSPQSTAGNANNASGNGDDHGVNVVASGTVGPYDFNVISVSQNAADPAELALQWLADNGYDVSLLGEDILASYLEEGLNLAAFRLTKNSNAGSIRPVLISYQSDQPVIPIRPTAVAANPDMGVMVWVVGAGRAVPTNYRSLILNDALINWFNPGSTYNDVVIAAADEAGGHGFVTEYASAENDSMAIDFEQTLVQPFELTARDQLNHVGLGQLLSQAWSTFGSWDGFREVLEGSVRVRDGATLDELMDCMDCYLTQAGPEPLPDQLPPTPAVDAGLDAGAAASDAGDGPVFAGDPIWLTNPERFLQLLDALVIEPVRLTAELFPGQRVTRLYTTLSADEMTSDPAFDFNLSLEGVSNQHIADRYLYCDGRWVIRLPSGFVLQGGSTGTWPVSIANDIPVNLRVTQDNTDGEPELITNNHARIASQLETMGVTSTWPPPPPESESNCGCRVAGRAADVPWFLFGGIGLAVCIRRRRRMT